MPGLLTHYSLNPSFIRLELYSDIWTELSKQWLLFLFCIYYRGIITTLQVFVLSFSEHDE